MTHSKFIGLIIFFLSIYTQTALGQTEEVSVELLGSHERIGSTETITISNDEYVMTFKLQGAKTSNLHIQTYDVEGLGLVASNIFDELDEKFALDHYAVITDKFYIFYSAYDNSEKVENLFALEVNPRTAEVIIPAFKLLSIDRKMESTSSYSGVGGLKKRVSGKYSILLDDNHENFLICYSFFNDVINPKKKIDEMGMHVFNAKFEQVWSREKTMRKPQNKTNQLAIFLDSGQNAYLAYEEIADDKGAPSAVKVDIFSEDNEAGKSIELPLNELSDINSMRIGEFEHEIVISGLNNSKNVDVEYFMVRIDSEGNLISNNQYEIPSDVLYAHMTDGETKQKASSEKKGKTFNHVPELKLAEMLFDTDGNVFLISQEEWYYVGSSYTTMYYGDIVIARISKDGELDWMNKIPKFQYGYYSSLEMSYQYVFGQAENELSVFYMDNADNLQLSKDAQPEKFFDGDGGVLTMASIDLNVGDISYDHVFTVNEVEGLEEFYFPFYNAYVINKAQIIVLIKKGKDESVWMRISLDK